MVRMTRALKVPARREKTTHLSQKILKRWSNRMPSDFLGYICQIKVCNLILIWDVVFVKFLPLRLYWTAPLKLDTCVRIPSRA